jgi:hypothetical protein
MSSETAIKSYLPNRGKLYFSSLTAIQAETRWELAFRQCHRHEACPLVPEGQVCVIKGTGELIPAGSVRFVPVSCPKIPHAPLTTML